jgi:hypothetical protein
MRRLIHWLFCFDDADVRVRVVHLRRSPRSKKEVRHYHHEIWDTPLTRHELFCYRVDKVKSEREPRGVLQPRRLVYAYDSN